MNHIPRKRFGQNFLQDDSIVAKILLALALRPDDNVVEIGPGLGALTQPLLRHLKKLTAIEIDRNLQNHLQSLLLSKDKLQLITADALTVDYSQWGENLRVIGNLPYNISTPLLFHLLKFKVAIKDLHFMLQKEVVERLCASPGTKTYGRLSVMMQYHCQVEHLFDVPAQAFYPKPKVNSAVVRLVPYFISPYPAVEVPKLERLVAQAFSMRRKTLANNLKSLVSKAKLIALGIDPLLRPEQLSIKEFVQIAKIIPDLM